MATYPGLALFAAYLTQTHKSSDSVRSSALTRLGPPRGDPSTVRKYAFHSIRTAVLTCRAPSAITRCTMVGENMVGEKPMEPGQVVEIIIAKTADGRAAIEQVS